MAARATRGRRFFLIASQNPPAADIVRVDFVSRVEDDDILAVGVKCKFQWENPSKQVEFVEGTILKIDTKTSLSKIFVDKDGKITEEKSNAVGPRKREIEKERLRQQNASALYLQELAEDMVQNGAATSVQSLKPVCRLPKKRSTETKQEIENLLMNMPCLKKTGTYTSPLLKDRPLWGDVLRLTYLKMKYRCRPRDHFRKLLVHLIPKNVLLTDGVGVTSKRGCVKIPNTVLDVTLTYVTLLFQKAGGDIDSLSINADQILRDLISNTRKKARGGKNAKANAPTASDSSVMVESSDGEDAVQNQLENEVHPVHVQNDLNAAAAPTGSCTSPSRSPSRSVPFDSSQSSPTASTSTSPFAWLSNPQDSTSNFSSNSSKFPLPSTPNSPSSAPTSPSPSTSRSNTNHPHRTPISDHEYSSPVYKDISTAYVIPFAEM